MIIEIPTNCPSCSSTLEIVNERLFCRNPACDAKTGKQVEHFAKTLKIHGLGKATIDKLGISSIIEIYDLTKEDIISRLGSEKLGNKLYQEIKLSQGKPLEYILPALGIPLCGATAASKLQAYSVENSIPWGFMTIEDYRNAGLGAKASANLVNWLEVNEQKYVDLFTWDFSDVEQRKASATVCISGKLTSFKTKKEATEWLEQQGFSVVTSVTKTTDFLINEAGAETEKTKKARQYGITILESIKELIK